MRGDARSVVGLGLPATVAAGAPAMFDASASRASDGSAPSESSCSGTRHERTHTERSPDVPGPLSDHVPGWVTSPDVVMVPFAR